MGINNYSPIKPLFIGETPKGIFRYNQDSFEE